MNKDFAYIVITPDQEIINISDYRGWRDFCNTKYPNDGTPYTSCEHISMLKQQGYTVFERK